MTKFLLLSMLFFIAMPSFSTPLPAEEIFQISVHKQDANTFSVNWTIKTGYFLYKDRIKLSESPKSNAHIGTIYFPTPINKTDHFNKIIPIYRDRLVLPIATLGKEPGEALIEVHYQGCSDAGFCYPPQQVQVKLTINTALELSAVTLEDTETTIVSKPTPNHDTTSSNPLFSSNNWAVIIVGFFSLGLLLAFTPCVLPMVPILSGIIVGHGKDITKRKSFLLSLSYVLSMSLTYAVVGAIIALMGNNLQIVMQSPWAIGAFSGIFVLLALSMFDFYELRLPLAWQSKLASLTRNQAGGHYLGAAFMGCMSTLILSPCVTAPMLGALSYIASTGNVILGIVALFFLSLGMGTPLILVGISAGKLLPKAGRWMNAVKSIFGILFLIMAIYLLERIIPAPLTMGLWASLLIFTGLYLGAFSRASSNQDKFYQGLGIIALMYGLLILIGASQGHSNPLLPLRVSNETPHSNSMIVVKTLDEAKKALASAKGKPVMLDFYADWCTACKVIAATTLKDPQVKTALQHFVVIKVDLTPNNAETRELLNYFNIIAPPTFDFVNAKGQTLEHLRLVGETPADVFSRQLKQVSV